MDSGMNPDQIERVFGALGRIEAKIDSAAAAVVTHAAHDETVQRALFERIELLQLAHAKQKGAITVIAAVGSAVAGAVGYIAERFLGLGHH